MKAEEKKEAAEKSHERKERTRKKKREKEKRRNRLSKLRSRLICGPIELNFCQCVSSLMFFILTGWFILGISLPTFFVNIFVELSFGEISPIFFFKSVFS